MSGSEPREFWGSASGERIQTLSHLIYLLCFLGEVFAVKAQCQKKKKKPNNVIKNTDQLH